jgi:hypothetical protein
MNDLPELNTVIVDGQEIFSKLKIAVLFRFSADYSMSSDDYLRGLIQVHRLQIKVFVCLKRPRNRIIISDTRLSSRISFVGQSRRIVNFAVGIVMAVASKCRLCDLQHFFRRSARRFHESVVNAFRAILYES